jgi:hypothetical protein
MKVVEIFGKLFPAMFSDMAKTTEVQSIYI